MTENHTKHLSTTALAKSIGKESKELFVLLANSGWIVKVDGHWHLTAKGRFEGGTYANHPRFGEYIVWPETLSQHPVMGLLPEAPLSARNLAQKTGLPARLVNRLLATLGWITPYVHGWQVTARGKELGAQQRESETTAIPYVMWPETLLDNISFRDAVAALKADATQVLDGHSQPNAALTLIDNWLYVCGLLHATQYKIGVDSHSDLVADFYIPSHNVAIVYWPDAPTPTELAANLTRREKLQHTHCKIIELEHSQLNDIYDVLTKEFMKLGCAIY